LDPRFGNISFGSGKQGWAFTLPQFADMISQKSGVDSAKILRRLWGDHFYDPERKKFLDTPMSPSGVLLPRYVCQMVFEPLIHVFRTLIDKDVDPDELDKILKSIDVKLTNQELNRRGQDLLTRVMQLWISAGDALVEMIINKLPSPIEAQRYRVEKLYTGPLDDECGVAIRECDPNGPVMAFISKMVPTSDSKRFYAFGRVFFWNS